MESAVITGATGCIGQALVHELVSNGVEVMVLLRPGSPRNDAIPDIPGITKRCCSLSQLAGICGTGEKWDVMYHLGWQGTSGKDRDNMDLQNLNVRYAMDAVEAARRLGCRRFVGVGSQAEYGRTNGPLSAYTPEHPETPYGIAKKCAGYITRSLAHQKGLSHIWVRVLSVYGPGDRPDSMVMSSIHKLERGGVPQYTKGEQIWDYLYSADAAKALYLLGEKGKDGRTYVLGSGEGRPLAEYIREIRDVVSPGAKIRMGALEYGEKEVMFLQADTAELFADTGWRPGTSFREGIRRISSGESMWSAESRTAEGRTAESRNAESRTAWSGNTEDRNTESRTAENRNTGSRTADSRTAGNMPGNRKDRPGAAGERNTGERNAVERNTGEERQ